MKGLKCIEMIGKNELVKTFNQQEKDFPYILDCIILKHISSFQNEVTLENFFNNKNIKNN